MKIGKHEVVRVDEGEEGLYIEIETDEGKAYYGYVRESKSERWKDDE